MSTHFPPWERDMIDQIRRSSRSICANIGEAYGVRKYSKHFQSKLAIAVSENYETQVWLDFAKDLDYLSVEQYAKLCNLSEEVGRLLSFMNNNPDRFAKWKVL